MISTDRARLGEDVRYLEHSLVTCEKNFRSMESQTFFGKRTFFEGFQEHILRLQIKNPIVFTLVSICCDVLVV